MVEKNINEKNDKEIFLSARGLDDFVICNLWLLYVDVIPGAGTPYHSYVVWFTMLLFADQKLKGKHLVMFK